MVELFLNSKVNSDFGRCTAHEMILCSAGWLHDWEKTVAEIASPRNDCERTMQGLPVGCAPVRACVALESGLPPLYRRRTVSERERERRPVCEEEDLLIERVWGSAFDNHVMAAFVFSLAARVGP